MAALGQRASFWSWVEALSCFQGVGRSLVFRLQARTATQAAGSCPASVGSDVPGGRTFLLFF